jgi:hypothetical protein
MAIADHLRRSAETMLVYISFYSIDLSLWDSLAAPACFLPALNKPLIHDTDSGLVL